MRFTLDFRNRFPNRLREQFESYITAVHPFTIDKVQLYRASWTDEEWHALQVLKDRKNEVLEDGRWLRIKLKSIGGKRDWIKEQCSFTIRMSDGRNYNYEWPDSAIDDDQLQNPALRRELLAWCVTAAKYTATANALSRCATTILGERFGVNTPGQLYRAWPEIACVMPEEYSQRIMGQSMRSAMPPNWTPDDIQKFRDRPYFDDINTAFLAMSLMELERRTDQYPVVQ